jgi:membrane complex biogenesis BtpA family protein
MKPFEQAIGRRKLLLGVVHLKPLPGSPLHDGQEVASITSAAREDAETILEAGFDGYIIENFGDTPFFKDRVPPHVLTIMTRIALELPRNNALVGVNVLRNDAAGALAIATACGLDMIRVNVHSGAMVTDQGIVEGDAAGTLRAREQLAKKVAILADVNVKHAAPVASVFDIRNAAHDTAYRGLADGLIVTGNATGNPCSPGDLVAVRSAVPDRPLLAGSGVNIESVRETLLAADGVIVGTSIKRKGRLEEPVDPGRAREFTREARGP